MCRHMHSEYTLSYAPESRLVHANAPFHSPQDYPGCTILIRVVSVALVGKCSFEEVRV